jgi:hypothetical protein
MTALRGPFLLPRKARRGMLRTCRMATSRSSFSWRWRYCSPLCAWWRPSWSARRRHPRPSWRLTSAASRPPRIRAGAIPCGSTSWPSSSSSSTRLVRSGRDCRVPDHPGGGVRLGIPEGCSRVGRGAASFSRSYGRILRHAFPVQDSGPDIDPEFRGRIFGAFKRQHGEDHPPERTGTRIPREGRRGARRSSVDGVDRLGWNRTLTSLCRLTGARFPDESQGVPCQQ